MCSEGAALVQFYSAADALPLLGATERQIRTQAAKALAIHFSWVFGLTA